MSSIILFVCLVTTIGESFANNAHFLSEGYIEAINSKQSQWKAGVNFGPNTPLSEVKKLLGTIMTRRESETHIIKTSDPLWPDVLPTNFDSREKWGKQCPTIGEVLDQGKCGSGWAIAAAQAFTDRYCIARKGKHKARLSTSRVLSCCHNCGGGCSGGWEHLAWDFFYNEGLPSGGQYNASTGCYPYNIQSPCNYNDKSPYAECAESRETPECMHTCTNRNYRKEMDNDFRFAKKRYSLPPNEETIMKDIFAHGPITASFKVKEDFLNYKSGVYEPEESSTALGGHAVKLIGWGVEKDVPYWLVMNSWNEYWGDGGLIKMKRNSQRIILENRCFAAEADV